MPEGSSTRGERSFGPEIRRERGRTVFGTDAAGYATGRPGYPDDVFDVLVERCGLTAGLPTLEIGPGAGQATVELLPHGAEPLVVVEPDPSLSQFLAERFGDRVEVRNETFEDALLDDCSFSLIACATAFHWINPAIGLSKVARLLALGGRWAVWWTAFHDPDRPDALYEALTPILDPLPQPPQTKPDSHILPFSFDRNARIAELVASGRFTNISAETFRWNLPLDGPTARALFGTFSPILVLDPPERANAPIPPR